MSNKSAVAEPETRNYRLPRTVVPSKYDIKLTPDLSNFSFAGEETVHVDVVAAVKDILLNAVDLKINHVEMVNDQGVSHSGTVTIDEKNERAQLAFKAEITPGKWQLKLKFEGALNDKLHGFYRSQYKDDQGVQKWIATTQFESTHARRAFPCWDEPDFKAVFRSALVVDENLTALSNAGVEKESKVAGGKKEVQFKDTMKMSTYLVAYVVGQFEGTEPIMADGKPIRIYAPPGKKHLTGFSQGIAKHSLTFFAKYYGVPYPGDKLDLIAVPDFAFGAMENLGCVTFRENALLLDEKTASHAEQERVADVVAHEIAHMWFGDLATMSWWNGIWLNEAFATFAEMLSVDRWKPEWKRWETFGASRAAALVVDGLKSTRPIEFPVHWPQECEGMFDVLTYEKGGSVLRMLEQYLTEPVFQKGISIYLDRHKFANTETSDLWAALEEASKQPVVQMMDSWIFHPGYPMISVEVKNGGKSLEVSQQRFFYQKGDQNKQLFHVPIMLRAKVGKATVEKKLLLTGEKASVDFDDKIEWVVVNEGGHGFYRVRYSSDLLKSLTSNVFSIMTPIERFNLVNDTWAMVVAGHTPLANYLPMAMLFLDETDKNVWSVLCGSLQYLDRLLPSEARAPFQDFVRKLVKPAQERLGWQPHKGENELTGQLRGLLIASLGVLGNDKPTQDKVRELYGKYKADKAAVDPNIVSALVSTVAFAGDAKQYEQFVEEFKTAKTPQDEERYMYALAGFRHLDLLEQTLQKCINGEVRTQNAAYLLRTVMMNNVSRQAAWEFTKKHWDTITSKFPNNSIARMCEGVTALVEPGMEKDVVGFFAAHPVTAGAKTVDQHMERLHVAVLFKEREGKTLSSIW